MGIILGESCMRNKVARKWAEGRTGADAGGDPADASQCGGL